MCLLNVFLFPVHGFELFLCFTEFDEPSALVVLLEEELVVIDLQISGWPTVPAPYLAPLHSSAITFSCHISNVPPKFWERVISAGQQQCPLQNYEVGELRTPHKDQKRF